MKDTVKVDMKDYYNRRKAIQELYINDVAYGDLAGTLLGIRDQTTSIESMILEIKDLRIRVEMVQGKTAEENQKILADINKVFLKLRLALNNYIMANVDKVVDPDTAKEIKDDISNGKIYYDILNVGNMIEINL